MTRGKSIFTRAVHAGERGPKPDFQPVSTPIYNTVGYTYEDLEDLDRIFGNERAAREVEGEFEARLKTRSE